MHAVGGWLTQLPTTWVATTITGHPARVACARRRRNRAARHEISGGNPPNARRWRMAYGTVDARKLSISASKAPERRLTRAYRLSKYESGIAAQHEAKSFRPRRRIVSISVSFLSSFMRPSWREPTKKESSDTVGPGLPSQSPY